MSGWILAIDFGTTSTAAARRVGDRVETIQLQGGPRMPSLVFWREATSPSSTGRLVLGTEAEELSGLAPWCLERAPKSRIGEEQIRLGDKQLRPVEVIAAILREVHSEALALSGGEAPAEIRLTHPARWQQTRLDRLAEAARIAGLNDPVFVPEPVAAAVHFASERLREGEHVVVYDLGGGTLDTAVLKREGNSFEVVGRTGGDEELGGEDFDDLLYRYLGEQLPAETWEKLRTADSRQDRVWAQSNRVLLRHARLAKEGLSRNDQYEFYLPPPIDGELRAKVEDFERLIAPTLRGTVAELERTVLAAGLQTSDLAAVYLAGGSSRIPLVRRLIEERLGIPPEHLDDPKAVIALGAARLDRQAARDSAVQRRPLDPTDAPIPPLPGGDEAPPGPPSDGDGAASGEGRGTTPAGAGETRAAAAAPPTPPGGTGRETRWASEPSDAGSSDGGGRSTRRTALIGGAAAVGIAAIAAIALLLLGGGGGGGDDTTVTQTAETTADTTAEATAPAPPVNDDAALEERVKLILEPKYRDECEPEPKKDYEKGALIGLICEGPPRFTLIIELFPDRITLLDAFREYAAGLPFQGPCGDGTWEVRTTWFSDRREDTKGLLACYFGDEDNSVITWTLAEENSIGFVIGPSGGTEDETLNAWKRAVP